MRFKKLTSRADDITHLIIYLFCTVFQISARPECHTAVFPCATSANPFCDEPLVLNFVRHLSSQLHGWPRFPSAERFLLQSCFVQAVLGWLREPLCVHCHVLIFQQRLSFGIRELIKV
jgi:hypothetical protein